MADAAKGLSDQLCAVLGNHCGERGVTEGAVETLERIIRERAALAERLKACEAERDALALEINQRRMTLGDLVVEMRKDAKRIDALKAEREAIEKELQIRTASQAEACAQVERLRAAVEAIRKACMKDAQFAKFTEINFWDAHCVDIEYRINGAWQRHQADWIKDIWYVLKQAALTEPTQRGGFAAGQQE